MYGLHGGHQEVGVNIATDGFERRKTSVILFRALMSVRSSTPRLEIDGLLT